MSDNTTDHEKSALSLADELIPLVGELRGLALEFSESIAATRKTYSGYDHEKPPYIIDHQLDRRDVGSEVRIVERAANTIEMLCERLDAALRAVEAVCALMSDEKTDAVKLLDPYSPDGCDHLRSRPCIQCRQERCEDWYDVYADKLKRIDDLEAKLAAAYKTTETHAEIIGELHDKLAAVTRERDELLARPIAWPTKCGEMRRRNE